MSDLTLEARNAALVSWLSDLTAVYEKTAAERDAALKACRAVVTDENDDPCHYDHHGFCQAHNLQRKGECYMELARAAVAKAEEQTR